MGNEINYVVHFWGSHPDTGNDDCWTGYDFTTLEEAREWLKDPSCGPWDSYCSSKDTAYFELEGPGVREIHANPGFAPEPIDNSDWRREQAMQAGMAFGCDGYNDALGY